MSMAGLARGAARRRKERQLRSLLRHEELSVKMALARALHHSTQPSGPVVEEPSEEAGHETYCGLRAPMPLRMRPAPLCAALRGGPSVPWSCSPGARG